jgi:predicted house-cleaning noncanonical NTP pyrophosphatase (MazG superfamily)
MRKKLVRDFVPETILSREGRCQPTYRADDAEYRERLTDKLVEEAAEFAANPCLEELADLREVIDAILEDRGWTREDLEDSRRVKARAKGTFTARLIMELP